MKNMAQVRDGMARVERSPSSLEVWLLDKTKKMIMIPRGTEGGKVWIASI